MRNFLRIGVAAVFSSLLSIPTPSIGEVSSVTQAGKNGDDLTEKGRQLRAQMEAEYHRLKEQKVLKRANDVTSIVGKFFPVGSLFSEAQIILRAAGFRTDGGVTTHGDLIFSTKIAGGGLSFSSVSFVVTLTPQLSGDFSIVQAVSAAILIEHI